MGYRTWVTIDRIAPEDKKKAEKAEKDFEKLMKNCDLCNYGDNSFEDNNGHGLDEIVEESKKYPDLLLEGTVDGSSEDASDQRKFRIRNGKIEQIYADITYAPFEEILTEEEKADREEENKKKARTPMHIPDLTPMYEAVKDYVLRHQGEKGFILTDDKDADAIYATEYIIDTVVSEFHVKAIRVKNNDLQIVTDVYHCTFTEDDVCAVKNEDWMSVRYSDNVHYIPTLFSIAESIQQYK